MFQPRTSHFTVDITSWVVLFDAPRPNERGSGGKNTAILTFARPDQSSREMYQWILVFLQSLTLLFLPVQAETLTFSPCAGFRHWGLSGPAFGPEALSVRNTTAAEASIQPIWVHTMCSWPSSTSQVADLGHHSPKCLACFCQK